MNSFRNFFSFFFISLIRSHRSYFVMIFLFLRRQYEHIVLILSWFYFFSFVNTSTSLLFFFLFFFFFFFNTAITTLQRFLLFNVANASALFLFVSEFSAFFSNFHSSISVRLIAISSLRMFIIQFILRRSLSINQYYKTIRIRI